MDLNYIVDIETKMRSYGVVVPLTFNDVRPFPLLMCGWQVTDDEFRTP